MQLLRFFLVLFQLQGYFKLSKVQIGDDQLDLLPIIIIFLFFFIGCLLSLIPAGIGVCILGILLRNQERKGILTLSKAVKTGILLAGIAIIIIICCGGQLDIFLTTHGMEWYSFLDDLKQGTLIANLPGYLQYYLHFVKLHWVEILLAISIACVEGGWLGKHFAKQLLPADH